jgi:serine/threonine protein kinase
MKFDFLKTLFEAKKRIPKTDITRRFELLGRVGQGSMSRVWRARDTLSGKIVALKVLDKEKTKRFESRFALELKKPSEGEIAVTLKHPNIVTTYEWGMTTDGEQFLVMEFVDGLGLSYLVDVQNDVMQKNRLSFIVQLGEAIRSFHDQKWIHRDICPRNVMVSDGDLVLKLIDFGLVVPNTPPFQAPGNRTGTANYMAPELIKRQRTDQRIDVFSYAVTCFEMFTKTFPWKAAESIEAVLQHINTPPHDIREFAPGIDEQVAKTIMKGIVVNPNDRWQAIGPMLYQFREAQERLSPSKSTKPKRAVTTTGSKSAPRPKAPVKSAEATPGITLAEEGITVIEEGITLAEDQSQEVATKPAKAAPAAPGITLAEEGITLAEDQPPDKRLSPTPGITLAEDEESSPESRR